MLLEAFFWNSQNIANLAFRFEDAAPDTHSRPTKPWPKPWTRKPRKRRTRKRNEMLTWTTSNGEVSFDVVVDAGKMQQCLRDRCRLNICFKPSSNHKPNIFQSQVQTYLQKMTKL